MSPPRRRRLRLPDPVTAGVVLATAVFALAGIGSPLLGLTVFADTGSLADYSGYRDALAGVRPQTVDLRDQVDAAMPNSILFGEALRSGEFAAWNPYALGGGPLGSTPNLAIASPMSLPWWFLPGWLAPAYVKLLEVTCSIGGCYLFLRRVRLGRAAAWLGGLVFATSAFMVVWTGWPQTRVAAVVPALFWAVERLAQRVRVREVALVALPVAGMVLGGFPAVTGYALLTAAAYLLVRIVAEHRRRWRPILGRLGAATAGLAAGLGLAAWQLLPWVRHMTSVLVLGRSQNPGSHIPPESLLTAIAPYAFGTVSPARPPDWFGGLRLIDAEAYVGGAALVLVVTALALAGTARTLLPRGVWWLLVGASAGWTVAIFFGGPLLGVLQRLPFLFSDNFVGRARSVLGFLFAVLAAVGLEAVLRRPRPQPAGSAARPRLRRAYGVAIWLCLAAGATALYLAGRRVTVRADAERDAGEPSFLPHFNAQLIVGLSIVAVSAACVGWLWWGSRSRTGPWPWARTAVAVAVPVLIAVQALWWVQSYYPRTDRENFYPPNPTQAYLAAHLGHDRYYGADGAIYGSVDVIAGVRGYHGHGFVDRTYADLAETLPGEQFVVPPTAIVSDAFAGAAAVSPVLDRAAVTYYVAPPDVQPFGPVHTQVTDGTVVSLVPGQAVALRVPVTGPVRGIGVTPVSPPSAPLDAHLSVVLRDSSGQEVTRGERLGGELTAGTPWMVPLTAEDVPAGAQLTVEITVGGSTPLTVVGHAGRPAVSVVASTGDGLRLTYANESVIYQRTRALDRARWASSAVVETDPAARVQLVASGRLDPGQVVLDGPGPPADGEPARITWIEDGLNRMVLTVDAEGAGYLVLADALQNGWSVSVDGAAATLVSGDHAFVAVAVGAGSHTVRFFYPPPWLGSGAWITGLTAAALLVGLAAEGWRERRRRAG